MPHAVAIIPARFNSTRFPGKPLVSLKGKPVIQHVYEQAMHAESINNVLVATDDKRIFDAVNGFGGRAVMTSVSHASGTDRIAEAAMGIDCDIIVNVQGDEPFIKPQMIDDVVEALNNDNRASMSTLAKQTTDLEEIFSPNIVKVVFDSVWFAMYFSRAPIPYYRDEWIVQNTEHRTQNTDSDILFKLKTRHSSLVTCYCCYKHIGIYGYRKDILMRVAGMPEAGLEKIEKLEQLRALASGIRIKVKETSYDTFGIDIPEDLRKAEEWLNSSS
ncbi:MAG: 3-deoxy-manno-octulosonate cytidylyltransferase [Nitrospirae bacterium]|nr:3-deoxy-manno-octulosonate cytidylyltransferase [Nitrospirota bacterium]